MRAVSGRHREAGRGTAADHPQRPRVERRRHAPAARCRAGYEGRLDLRSRPDRLERGRVRHRPPRNVQGDDVMTATDQRAVELGMPARAVTLTVDGRDVSVPEGSTILDACDAIGEDVP